MELLRQLELDQKKRWDQRQPITQPMMQAKDCDPSLLSGWTDRDISVWDISDSNGKPGLQRILVALCKRKKNWDKIGYVLFSCEAVSSAGLQLTKSFGNTGDSNIDLSNTHFEIKGITGKNLCTLIHIVSQGTFSTGIFTKAEMEKILYEAYDKSYIKPSAKTATTEVVPSIPVFSGTSVLSLKSQSELGLSSPVVANEGRLPRSSANTTTD
jgi:hypothetical protein